jgi:hypothetical protein
MSSVSVMTPIIVASWPVIMQAVAGAAASMGFAIAVNEGDPKTENAVHESVETQLEGSDIAENIGKKQSIVMTRNGVKIEFKVDGRGRCTVCASGPNLTKTQLKAVADEVAGKVTQQYVYNKLMTELQNNNFKVTSQAVGSDQSIQVQVQLQSMS